MNIISPILDYIYRFHSAPVTALEREKLFGRIRTMAFWLDRIPGLPIGIGLDALIGFIPFIGDFLGAFMSVYQVYLSFLFGLPPLILAKMCLNVCIDFVIGWIPIAGRFMDVAWHGNIYNLNLLEQYLQENKLVDVRLYNQTHPMEPRKGYKNKYGGPATGASAARGSTGRGWFS